MIAREGGRALAPSAPAQADPRLAAAEARRREALAEVDALDAEVERLAAALGEFTRRYESSLAEAFAELADAERLVRRIQALEDELSRLAARLREGLRSRRPARSGGARVAVPAGPPGRKVGRPASPGAADPGDGADDEAVADVGAEAGALDPEEAAAEVLEVEGTGGEADLKRLHRRLARLLHPDLAGDDAERGRLEQLMARLNDAWARRDRAALELLAERAGSGLLEAGDLSDEERLAHLARRAAALEGIAAALRRERDRLVASETFRLREEDGRRAAGGGDLVEETRRDLEAESAEVWADARQRLGRLWRSAADAGRLWRTTMTGLVRRGGGGLRAFDPLAESPLVRRGAMRLERQRASAAARDLARRLEEAAERAPWQAAAALMAAFAEEAGGAPESLARPEGWAERWESLRAAWPEAPAFERLLARLPTGLRLELGLRASADVTAGLQLASSDLLAGVHLALAREPVARVARRVLAILGPRLACRRCRAPRQAVHVVRTRGLDEVHGLACPDCGAVLRSYWRYGEPEGLEALGAVALRVGLVAEQTARLGGATLAFQVPAADRERLSAGRLRALFAELYLQPCRLDLAPGLVEVRVGGKALAASAPVPVRGVRLAPAAAAGMTDRELEAALRARIARRFRPGTTG